jgi:branched-chain amino acid transport system permease protein
LQNTFLWQNFWNLTITGLSNGAIYALIALGYTLVYGVLRLINFAHSEVFMLGTFGALIAATKLLNVPILIGGQYPYKFGILLVGSMLFCLVVAMVFSGLAAVVLERVAYRPLRGSGDLFGAASLAFLTGFVIALIFVKNTWVAIAIAVAIAIPLTIFYLRILRRGRSGTRLAFLISAIGASVAIAEAVAIWGPSGREVYPSPRLLEKQVVFRIFDGQVRIDYLIVIVGALLMMVALTLFVSRTRLGRGIRAVAQDVETSQLMGVNINRVIMVTFLLGGLMAGVAAAMFDMVYDLTRYDIGFALGVKSFTAAVLGGIGNLKGALLGGILLGLVENYGSAIFGSEWKDVISFVVLLVVLMFRPTGLLGESLGRARV